MAEVMGYSLPEDLLYHREFMWVKKLTDKSIRVGVTDFFQSKAGDINFIEQPEPGEKLTQDELIGMLETGKWIGKIYSPMSGEVTRMNGEIATNAGLINEDPYGEGWLFEMEINDPSEYDNLLEGEAAVKWQEEEIENPHQT